MVEQTKKVLIIDDEEDINYLTAKRVKHAGYTVDSLFEGTQALQKIQAFRPDLILLDIKMPGISGFDVFAQIRSSDEFHKLPVIFLSAYQAERDHCLNTLKANGFMSKPYDATALITLIRDLLPA